MLEPFNPRFDRKDEFLPEDEFADLLSGEELLPPDFDFSFGNESPQKTPHPSNSQSERDAFITETARREMETTADFARFLPFDALQEISQVSHPVKDKYLHPLKNANVARQNLRLLIEEWQAQDPAGDDRKLAYLLATALHESRGSLQSGDEAISPAQWEDGKIRAYADTGYWGRGLVQLKWEAAYRKLGEELGLDLLGHPRMAALPTIALDIMGTGMFGAGIAKSNTLGQFFSGSNEDWSGARSIVGNSQAEPVAQLARAIHAELRSFREKKAGGLLPPNADRGDYLMAEGQSLPAAPLADVLRILHGLGLFQFPRPNFASPLESQIQYLLDTDVTGYGQPELGPDSPTVREALSSFQQKFNRDHKWSPALNESGDLDEATRTALLCGGHQMAAGRAMIRYAFGGALKPIDPIAECFQQLQRNEIPAAQAARQLLGYMPTQQAEALWMYFQALPPHLQSQLGQAFPKVAEHDRQLALLPQAFLRHLSDLLQKEDPGAVARVQSLLF